MNTAAKLVDNNSEDFSKVLKEQSFSRIVFTDFWQMTVLFLMSVYAVYYAPGIVNYAFFLVPLILFWFSKKDYFWFGYFFILISMPAYFFSETASNAVNRLPLYSITSGLSFSVFDLFIVLSVAKVIYKNSVKKFYVSKSFRFILFYTFTVAMVMTIVLGMGDSSFFNNIRPYTYYLVLITFYFLIDRSDDLYKYGYLMLPYLFFIIFDQFYLITTDELLIAKVDPYTTRRIVDDSVSGGTRAVFGGEILVFYVFLFGLMLSQSKRFELFKGFSYIIIFTAFASVVVSQTRSWLVMTSVVMVAFLFHNKDAFSNIIKLAGVSAFVVIVVFTTQLITVDYFVDKIWPRFGTFFIALQEGNLQNFDTAGARLESDLPFSIEGVMKSPILGAGFSGIYRTYVNNDLGFINTILIYGFVGFLIFLNVLIVFLNRINKYIRNKFQSSDNRLILISIKVIFLGMMVGYATTYDFFTVRQIERIYFVSVLIASAEISVNQIKQNQLIFFKQQDVKTEENELQHAES